MSNFFLTKFKIRLVLAQIMKKGDKDFLKLQFILRQNDIGANFENSSEEFDILNKTILFHPDSLEKIGCGISYFTIENSPVRATDKHFVIVRTDNSRVDFSIYKCCSNSKKSDNPCTKFSRALRWVVKKEIDDFRNESFKSDKYLSCPITGLKTSKDTCQIDHPYPNTWDSLVAKFVELENININDIKYIENQDSAGDYRLENKELSQKFYDFHKQNAKLRIVYWRANLQQKRTRKLKDLSQLSS